MNSPARSACQTGRPRRGSVLSATPGARVALGLKQPLTPEALRAAIRDGSISGLAQWCAVVQGDVIFIPGGTIRAIGANIVLAEIQQRGDTTYRLFDFDRDRELREDAAVAASDTRIDIVQPVPRRLSEARTVLVTSRHFVLERADLDPGASWMTEADQEAWILVIDGNGQIGSAETAVGGAIFMEADSAVAKSRSSRREAS